MPAGACFCTSGFARKAQRRQVRAHLVRREAPEETCPRRPAFLPNRAAHRSAPVSKTAAPPAPCAPSTRMRFAAEGGGAFLLLHEHLRPLLEHRRAHGRAHRAPRVLAVLVVLQELARRQTARVGALRVDAPQHVLPQRLGDVAVRRVGAPPLRCLALRGVPQKQKPALLLHDVRLLDVLLRHHPARTVVPTGVAEAANLPAPRAGRAALARALRVRRHCRRALLLHLLLHLLLLLRGHVGVSGRHLELLLRAPRPRTPPLLRHLLLLHEHHLLLLLLRLRRLELRSGHLLALAPRRRLRVVQALLHALLHRAVLLLLHHQHVLLLLRAATRVVRAGAGTGTGTLHRAASARVLLRGGAAKHRRAVAHHHVPAAVPPGVRARASVALPLGVHRAAPPGQHPPPQVPAAERGVPLPLGACAPAMCARRPAAARLGGAPGPPPGPAPPGAPSAAPP